MWQLDRPLRTPAAPVADRVALPVGGVPLRGRGRRAWHAWWATVIVLVVDGAVLASFIYAYVHAGMLLAICPPPGAGLPEPAARLGACFLLVLASAAMAVAGRRRCVTDDAVTSGMAGRAEAPRGKMRRASVAPLVLWIALALLCAVAGVALGVAGIEWAPVRSAWHASAAVLAAYLGLHVALLAVLACYLWARAGAGLLTPESRASLDCCALCWHATSAQGICLMLLL
jgi:cytochrome c oxidase subunit I+III